MRVAILTVGDEILLGQILDTNSHFLAQELAKIGAETVEMRSIQDTRPEILRAISDSLSRADVVVMTGGLGPTKDDITKAALAEFFQMALKQNPQVYRWLEEMFADTPERFNAYNRTQAILPDGCVPLQNLKGTACGMWFEKEGKVLVALPGVPFEAEHIFLKEVLPRLKEKFHARLLSYKSLTVFDIPEAELAMRLASFERSLPSGIALAYLPSVGFIRLRLTNKQPAVAVFEESFNRLCQELVDLKFSLGEESGVSSWIQRLKASRVTVACAESCTGGNISHLITGIPGVSEFFMGGVVAYSNEVKKSVLKVEAADLEQFGAVSESVSLQMAHGVRSLTGAEWAVSTTGIAGPEGGTTQKPVGTVWIAVVGPAFSRAWKFLFSRTRERNIGRASITALKLLVESIESAKS